MIYLATVLENWVLSGQSVKTTSGFVTQEIAMNMLAPKLMIGLSYVRTHRSFLTSYGESHSSSNWKVLRQLTVPSTLDLHFHGIRMVCSLWTRISTFRGWKRLMITDFPEKNQIDAFYLLLIGRPPIIRHFRFSWRWWSWNLPEPYWRYAVGNIHWKIWHPDGSYDIFRFQISATNWTFGTCQESVLLPDQV